MIRPGVVLGPREYVGRLPWWLRRIAAGGRVIAPAPSSRPIQPVDARDLAAFAVRCAIEKLSGAFNAAAPIGPTTFDDMLSAYVEMTGSDADLAWVPDDVLLAHGVRQWSELPLWRTFEGVWGIDATRAADAGLACRPIADTVRDTWAWMQAQPESSEQHERAAETGLGAEREAAILADLT